MVPVRVGVLEHLSTKTVSGSSCRCKSNFAHKEVSGELQPLWDFVDVKASLSSPLLCVFRLKSNMDLLRTFAPWVLVLLLGNHVCASPGERSGADDSVTEAPRRGQARGSKSSATGRGKFSTIGEEDRKMQCTWVAGDVPDGVRISVNCEDPGARITGGVTQLGCQYNGKPQLCPGYQSNPKSFWKQVARAFKKLPSRVCSDDRALVKTSLCKGAPRAAHFKLDLGTSVVSAQSGEGTPEPSACTAQSRRKAEENCNSSWVGLCELFFSMVERDC